VFFCAREINPSPIEFVTPGSVRQTRRQLHDPAFNQSILPIPTGLHHPARELPRSGYPGERQGGNRFNPERVASSMVLTKMQPLQGWRGACRQYPSVARGLATLGWMMQSRWDCLHPNSKYNRSGQNLHSWLARPLGPRPAQVRHARWFPPSSHKKSRRRRCRHQDLFSGGSAKRCLLSGDFDRDDAGFGLVGHDAAGRSERQTGAA